MVTSEKNGSIKAKVARKGGQRPTRTAKEGPALQGGIQQARRQAAAILEALAGVVRPADAARAIGVSLPRYYVLERRALEGLIRACEPVDRSHAHRPEKQIERLQKDVQRLERECIRWQALARVARRIVGLSPEDISGHRSGKKGKQLRSM